MNQPAEKIQQDEHEADPSDFEGDREKDDADEAGVDEAEGEGPPHASEQAKPDERDQELVKLRETNENLNRALQEERTKRQEAQRYLEFQLFQARHGAAAPAQTPPAKSEAEDDDAIAPLVRPVLEREITPLSQELRQMKAQLSESAARGRYRDYDSVVSKVLPVIQSDESMRTLFLHSQDPAEFAYRMGVFMSLDERLAAAREEGRREALEKLKGGGKGGEAPPLQELSSVRKQGGAPSGDDNDISVEEAARLTPQAWAQLPEKTRRRLLGIS